VKLPKDWPIILLILFLAAAKYFYQALVLNPFEIDQEFLALEAWNFLKLGKATLIGAHTSVGGMYIGPFYTYFITLLMFLTKLNPHTINIASAVWATATAVSLYFIGRKLFSREVGMVAGILAAVSLDYLSLLVVPPLVIPLGLVSLLTFYSISQWSQDRRFFIVSIILAGIGLHLHLTGLYLSAFILLWLFITQFKLHKSDLIITALLLLFFLSPLIAFDLRHNFLNSRNFITFLLTTNGLKVILWSVWRSGNLSLANLGALFNSFQNYNLFLGGLAWGLFALYFIFNRAKTSHHKLLLIWSIFPVIVNGLYTGELLPYYYIFHHAQIFLVLGLLLEPVTKSPKGCTAVITLTLLYTLLNLRYHSSLTRGYSLNRKVAAFEFIKSQAGTTDINLSFTVEHARRGGLDFLRNYYGFDTELKSNRPTYTIVIPHGWESIKADKVFGEVDVILPPPNP